MIITDQDALNALCQKLAQEPFITIDTEFLRDSTYYPLLCLVQVAPPKGEAVAIDPLVAGLDLTPLYDLLANPSVMKVFHAARQDIETFFNLNGQIPTPIFDTQVAAMVCGFGDQIGYQALVQEICKLRLDKGAQFTDWSRRPLRPEQLSYALDDVTHLRDVYLRLNAILTAENRTDWVLEEMAILTNPRTYQVLPEDAWKRIKLRSDKPKALAVLIEVARWREEEAQRRNVPRSRIIRDETLMDLATQAPRTADKLAHVRGIGENMANGKMGRAILEAVERGLALPSAALPQMERRRPLPPTLVPVVEMLKMLLRIVAAENDVAARLIASPEDLEEIARGETTDIAPLTGWRHDVFGREALDMKAGRVGLAIEKGQITRKHFD